MSPQREQIIHVDRPAQRVDVLLAHAQAADDEVAHRRPHRLGQFEAHDAGHPPLAQLLLDHRQQVVGVLLVHLDVGVARDAEQVVLQHAHAGKQRLQVAADHALQRHEAAFGPAVAAGVVDGQRHPPRQVFRQLDPHEAPLARARLLDHHAQRLAQVADERERVAGVDRQRRQDREDVAAEEVVRRRLVGVAELGVAADAHAVLFQGRVQLLVPAADLAVQQRADLGVDQIELLGRRQAVHRPRRDAGGGLALEAADALHEELVEVAGEDRQKFDPLQQRHLVVLGQFQDAAVEVEPADLAVEEQRVADVGGRHGAEGVGGGAGEGRRIRGRHSKNPPPA